MVKLICSACGVEEEGPDANNMLLQWPVYQLVLKDALTGDSLLDETTGFCSDECAAMWYDESFVEIRAKQILERLDNH